jgi:hypothetical protein
VAGNSRKVEFDLLVTGTETGGAKVERLGDKMDELRHKVQRLDGTTARVKGIVKLDKDTDRLGDKVSALGASMLAAGVGVAKFATYLGLMAGAAAPLAVGIGVATVAVAQFVAQVSFASAALLPLAAGAALVTLTFKGMGEEFLKSVEPITAGWTKQTAAAGRLATRGLKPLAKEFARLNLPVIAEAQRRMARSTDQVITGFGKWVNSAAGVKVIRDITGDTAATFERLLPSVRGVAQSLIALAGRVSGVSFKAFGDTAQYALDKLNGFIDTIGADDVTRGFDKIKQAARTVVDAFNAIVDAINWVEANRQKILALSDAILVLTAVGAALLGGWVVALGATLILLARHWDTITAAVKRVRDNFQATGDKMSSLKGTLESFRGAWDRIKEGFRDFAATVGPRVGPMLDRVEVSFIKLQPAISGVVTALGALGKAVLQVAGPLAGLLVTGIGLAASAFGDLALAATFVAGKVLSAMAAMVAPIATLAKKLKLPFADALQSMVDGARASSARINESMAQVKTDLARREITALQAKVDSLKGKKVKTEADRAAIAASEARIRSLQATINRLQGKTVTVTSRYVRINETRNFVGNPVTGARPSGMRAAGGPVTKGRAYIVGERRSELFVPSENGRVEPRVPSGWRGGTGGGAPTVNNYYSFPSYVGDKRDLVRALDDLRRSGRLPKAV